MVALGRPAGWKGGLRVAGRPSLSAPMGPAWAQAWLRPMLAGLPNQPAHWPAGWLRWLTTQASRPSLLGPTGLDLLRIHILFTNSFSSLVPGAMVLTDLLVVGISQRLGIHL